MNLLSRTHFTLWRRLRQEQDSAAMEAAQPSPIGLEVRPAAFAGSFYPADAATCHEWVSRFLEKSSALMQVAAERQWLGAIVPHAGWICSGQIAGHSLVTLANRKQDRPVDLVVVFGAVHTVGDLGYAALDPHRVWALPSGPCAMQMELQAKLTESGDLFRVDERAHRREHAVEVELPLIQAALVDVPVLPIETPPVDEAARFGQKSATPSLRI